MKLRLLVAATIAALTLTAGSVGAQDTTSEKGKLSYAIGYKTGIDIARLQARGEQIDINAVIKALQDAVAKKDPAVPAEQLGQSIESMQKRLAAKAKAEFDKMAAENKTKSDTFLAQNKGKSGVKTLASGVQYRVLEAGSGGAKPNQTSQVQISYKGTLPDGRVIVDTAQAAPNQPAGPVSIKVSEIPLSGLREVLQMMPTGARWEVVMPGNAAYGTTVEAGELANQAVVFDVKLVGVK
jgi:peptidylprolyl isomerase